ncbi:hypothetical protein AB0I45_07170 [Brevibacterium sp. NPDC049920]|uniref:hypothetical protein n=1 Tax=Brevibacterium sp. NPDC049920 TaxID=3155279 RepID=UPI0033EE5A60
MPPADRPTADAGGGSGSGAGTAGVRGRGGIGSALDGFPAVGASAPAGRPAPPT